jgi:hypothetical protein
MSDANKRNIEMKKPNNIFAIQAAKVSEQVSLKLTMMQTARQQLAHANDLFAEGEGKSKEATEIADEAAMTLYQGRTDGVVSADEVSGALGDVFGYKAKSDGKPGKTPAGQGEAIRKRVVRATAAYDHLNGGDGGRFFEGLTADSTTADGLTLADVVHNVGTGAMSIWTAYEKFAEIKREHTVKTDIAFDAKRIAGIVGSLSEEGAADTLRNMPELIAAYGALIDVLNVVGEAAAKVPVEEADTAAVVEQMAA